jgi:hypothetical protein
MKILRPMMLLGILLFGSCTAVDEFSPRAVTYNLAAERAQNQTLLLNVVRSALRRPMQFTTVQSVTGTASESGTVQLTLPFGNRTPLSPKKPAAHRHGKRRTEFCSRGFGYTGILPGHYTANKRAANRFSVERMISKIASFLSFHKPDRSGWRRSPTTQADQELCSPRSRV